MQGNQTEKWKKEYGEICFGSKITFQRWIAIDIYGKRFEVNFFSKKHNNNKKQSHQFNVEESWWLLRYLDIFLFLSWGKLFQMNPDQM